MTSPRPTLDTSLGTQHMGDVGVRWSNTSRLTTTYRVSTRGGDGAVSDRHTSIMSKKIGGWVRPRFVAVVRLYDGSLEYIRRTGHAPTVWGVGAKFCGDEDQGCSRKGPASGGALFEHGAASACRTACPWAPHTCRPHIMLGCGTEVVSTVVRSTFVPSCLSCLSCLSLRS